MKIIPSVAEFCAFNFQTRADHTLLDVDLQETYNSDSPGLVRLKCSGIFLINPLRVVAFIIAGIAKTFFLLMAPLFTVLFLLIEGVIKCKKWTVIQETIRASFKEWPEEMKEAVCSPGCALFYGFIIQGGAMCGVARPFFGRKIVALAERSWRENDTFLNDKVHLAPCFQPRPCNSRQYPNA